MDSLILLNVMILGAIAFIAAIVLYFVSQKFAINEDPRINKTEALLPGANCGACGKAGCHDFAAACVRADAKSFSALYCPVGGAGVMDKIASLLGFTAVAKEATVAVLRCQGTCENAPEKIKYTGIKSCRLANRTFIDSCRR